jgi:TRAP-type C4-dicarboxylate transport system substrate-binding protein
VYAKEVLRGKRHFVRRSKKKYVSSSTKHTGDKYMRSFRQYSLLFFATAIASGFAAGPAMSQEKMRISLDTNVNHVRNKGAEIFASELKKRVGDRLTVEIYPSAQLFRDRDVPKALRQGAIEMGIPGTWQLDGIEPNMAIQTLPMFYGVDPDTVHKVMDGKLGTFLNERMEKRMKVKVLGKWADAGMLHLYTVTKPVTSYEDVKGMKIRFPGGTANSERIKLLGGIPTMIPFPDLPLAMSQGVVSGVTSTHESIVSSKLYDSGLKYGFEDNQFMAQYVPLVNKDFWDKQPKDVQDAILQSWDIAVTKQREMARTAQIDARENLLKQGVKLAQPAPSEVLTMRKALMATQPDLIKDMKIDQDAVQVALEELRSSKVAF